MFLLFFLFFIEALCLNKPSKRSRLNLKETVLDEVVVDTSSQSQTIEFIENGWRIGSIELRVDNMDTYRIPITISQYNYPIIFSVNQQATKPLDASFIVEYQGEGVVTFNFDNSQELPFQKVLFLDFYDHTQNGILLQNFPSHIVQTKTYDRNGYLIESTPINVDVLNICIGDNSIDCNPNDPNTLNIVLQNSDQLVTGLSSVFRVSQEVNLIFSSNSNLDLSNLGFSVPNVNFKRASGVTSSVTVAIIDSPSTITSTLSLNSISLDFQTSTTVDFAELQLLDDSSSINGAYIIDDIFVNDISFLTRYLNVNAKNLHILYNARPVALSSANFAFDVNGWILDSDNIPYASSIQNTVIDIIGSIPSLSLNLDLSLNAQSSSNVNNIVFNITSDFRGSQILVQLTEALKNNVFESNVFVDFVGPNAHVVQFEENINPLDRVYVFEYRHYVLLIETVRSMMFETVLHH